jgi:septum formation protein
MDHQPFILASASPRRAELLRGLGYEFEVVPAPVAELHPEQFTPHEMCQVNAARKATAVACRHPEAIVLGADTLVFRDLRHYGKPQDLNDAARMLRELTGHTHQVITGVCLVHWREYRKRLFSELTSVKFRPLDEDRIQAYFARVNPLDKAGAYAIQEEGDMLVESIEGSFSNVVGLPIEALQVELEAFGVPRCLSV